MYKVIFFDLGDTLITDNKAWIPGAKDALIALHQSGSQLGIISNTGALGRADIIAALPQDFDMTLFRGDLVIFSSEVGIEKPAPDIFRLAVARAGLPPQQCL